jgi:hypothetical protein
MTAQIKLLHTDTKQLNNNNNNNNNNITTQTQMLSSQTDCSLYIRSLSVTVSVHTLQSPIHTYSSPSPSYSCQWPVDSCLTSVDVSSHLGKVKLFYTHCRKCITFVTWKNPGTRRTEPNFVGHLNTGLLKLIK